MKNKIDISESFWEEMKRRCKMPLDPFNGTFFAYFIGVVLFLGGFGIWASIYSHHSSIEHYRFIPTSIITYSIALWTTTMFELFTKEIINKKFLHILSIVGLVLMFVFLIFVYDKENYAYVWSIVGILFGLSFWYVVNVDNPALYEAYHESVKNDANEKHGGGWD